MKINKKILGIFLGLSLVSTFVVIANARDGVEISKKETQTVLENKEDVVKPNNFKNGEKEDVVLKVDNISNEKNETTEKDLVNFDMVILKVLYDNDLLSEEIFDDFLNNYEKANNLKLWKDKVLTIRGEENLKKLKDVVAKTDFNNVEITKEFFEQIIEKIKEVINKEKNKVEVLYSKIKEAYDKNDEKALVEVQNMRERDIILQGEDKIKKNILTEKEKENLEGSRKELKKSIEKRTKEGKLTDFGRKLLLDIKDHSEKFEIPKLNEKIEKINKIKFEDVKDLHKKLKINRNVEKFNFKGFTNAKEKN